jgi:hypothetical protein
MNREEMEFYRCHMHMRAILNLWYEWSRGDNAIDQKTLEILTLGVLCRDLGKEEAPQFIEGLKRRREQKKRSA